MGVKRNNMGSKGEATDQEILAPNPPQTSRAR